MKSKRGRKRIKEEEETVTVSIRMAESQRDKFRRLGGASWIRGKIDQAKDKKP